MSAPLTLLFAQSSGTPPLIDLFHAKVKPGVACYRIPAIMVLPDGTVIAAADERVPSCEDLRSNRDINIVLKKSKDLGKAWSPMETVLDFPPGRSASDPSFIYDRITGGLFLFYNYMDLDASPGQYRFHCIRSSDGGDTWSALVDITSMISSQAESQKFLFITSGTGVQTTDGILLHTLVDVGAGSARLFGSNDHGITWKTYGRPASPADETRVVELPDGRWMLNARVNKAGYRVVHISADHGETWTTRKEVGLPDPGCNAGLCAVGSDQSNSMLVFSNPSSATQRRSLTLRVSSDSGNTWSSGRLLYDGDAGYSCLAVGPDRTLFVLVERDREPVISLIMLPEAEWNTPGKPGSH